MIYSLHSLYHRLVPDLRLGGLLWCNWSTSLSCVEWRNIQKITRQKVSKEEGVAIIERMGLRISNAGIVDGGFRASQKYRNLRKKYTEFIDSTNKTGLLLKKLPSTLRFSIPTFPKEPIWTPHIPDPLSLSQAYLFPPKITLHLTLNLSTVSHLNHLHNLTLHLILFPI